MKQFLLLLSLILLFANNITAQDSTTYKYKIGFKLAKDTIYRSSKEDKLWNVEILAENNSSKDTKGYTIDVSVDNKNSTIRKEDYEIISSVNGKKISELKNTGNTFRLIINKEISGYKQITTLKLIL
jgi:hypothetical protein